MLRIRIKHYPRNNVNNGDNEWPGHDDISPGHNRVDKVTTVLTTITVYMLNQNNLHQSG